MSNQKVTGVVDSVWTKDKATRYGDKKIHYCKVDDVTFSTGFKKVFDSGQHVDIAVKFNYGELQYQDGVSTAGLPAATSGGASNVSKGNFQAKGGSNYGAKGKFPIDPKDGQMSIIRQSSMDRAVTLVRDMVTAGTIEAPASKEDYLKLCIEIALNITDYASGNDIMQLAAAKNAAKEAING